MFESMTLSQMIATSPVMIPLLILSVAVVTIGLERFWALFLLNKMPVAEWSQIKKHLQKGNRGGAIDICRSSDGVITEALGRMMTLPDPQPDRIVETFQAYRQRFHIDQTRRLGFFGTVSFIAPLIGLTGTVMGIMHAFHSLAKAGAGGPAVVAAGISEALVTTAAGISLAVISAILYNYFTLMVKHRMSLLDLWVFELADLINRAPAQQMNER